MAQKTPKTAVVAFKVEAELAEFLNQLPNKSAFIRKAIAAQMSTACPLCSGSGQVSKWAHDHYAPLLVEWNLRQCEGCGDKLTLPRDPGDLSHDDQQRLEQYFHGGPLLCDPCYGKAPPCDDCGWHISADKTEEHQHSAHHDHGHP
ncbi:MAG: hypothetical protein HYX68_09335 [Planctomycetes bacterium]|jgi:hypothetical protein|nr:hypothetical protein [Planctomycetota bacterium]